MVYPVSVWIGVVYLGEHYVVDALLGALYTVGAYYLAKYVCVRVERTRARRVAAAN